MARQAGEIEDDDHGIDAPSLHRYAPKVAFQVFHDGRLALRSGPGGVTLTVEDSGPGMEEADMHRLGERLFRVMGTGQSGSGLGWSIVRRIAAVLGPGIRVTRSAALGGLSVEVRFAAGAWSPP